MWVLAFALLIEVAIVIALWRIAKRSPGVFAKFLGTSVGLAAGCSIALAAESGYLFYTEDMAMRPDIQFSVFWLVAGIFGFAAAMALTPAQTSGSIPCSFLALLCLFYAWHLDHVMWIAAGLALAATAAVLWVLTAARLFGRSSVSPPVAPSRSL